MANRPKPYPANGTALERARHEAHELFIGDETTVPPHQRAQHLLNTLALKEFSEHGAAELPHSFATAILPDYRASAGENHAS